MRNLLIKLTYWGELIWEFISGRLDIPNDRENNKTLFLLTRGEEDEDLETLFFRTFDIFPSHCKANRNPRNCKNSCEDCLCNQTNRLYYPTIDANTIIGLLCIRSWVYGWLGKDFCSFEQVKRKVLLDLISVARIVYDEVRAVLIEGD